MAVVKADGYGHGAIEVARIALQNGAEHLGVARINEAIQLREAGLEAPILIFGYTPSELAAQLVDYDLSQTVYSFSTACALSDHVSREGKTIKIHIKVDSGMGRLGIVLGDLIKKQASKSSASNPVQTVASIDRLSGLEIEGMFTHFATSDSADKTYADKQLTLFMDFLDELRKERLEFPINHAANSAALIDLPDSHLNMVRPGIATYGLHPSREVQTTHVDLKPVMSLKCKIVHLKKVPAGFNVRYGITYQTTSPTTIATIPAGYADGFNRLLSNRGHMLVRGQRAPIVGRVCMDLTMLDVGNIDKVDIEDEVVIFGRQGTEAIRAEDLAAQLQTINYEIVSTITSRVPRIYID
jgi:alanine racemase